LKSKKLFLFIDGAARGNPGPAGIGVVIQDERGKRIKEFYKYIGEATNNVAEYHALVYGLQEVLMLHADEVVVSVDSELVAQQLLGEYRVKNESLRPLFEQALHMLSSFKHFEVRQVARENNKDADKLANRAINLAGLQK
jgi:ribonuclease HI